MEKELTTPKKLAYITPNIGVMVIEMEQGIATGSAAVAPGDSSSHVSDEWDIGTDREAISNW